MPFPTGHTLPELAGTGSLRTTGNAPTPVVVDVTALANYDTARPFMGMLVRLENVTLFSELMDNGGRKSAWLAIDGVNITASPKVTNALAPIDTFGTYWQSGAKFKSITGILQYFYQISIAPRSESDVVMQ